MACEHGARVDAGAELSRPSHSIQQSQDLDTKTLGRSREGETGDIEDILGIAPQDKRR